MYIYIYKHKNTKMSWKNTQPKLPKDPHFFFHCSVLDHFSAQAYLQSGQAFRGIGLAELWDPARLIPRAVKVGGGLFGGASAIRGGLLGGSSHDL